MKKSLHFSGSIEINLKGHRSAFNYIFNPYRTCTCQFLLPVKGDGGSGTLVNVYLFLLVIFKISYTLIKSKCFVFINYCCPFTIFAVILAAVL